MLFALLKIWADTKTGACIRIITESLNKFQFYSSVIFVTSTKVSVIGIKSDKVLNLHKFSPDCYKAVRLLQFPFVRASVFSFVALFCY